MATGAVTMIPTILWVMVMLLVLPAGLVLIFRKKHLSFYNRGISGNKITDIEVRWQKDAFDLKPDVLSILVGVNDVDSVIKQKDIVTSEKFEEIYRMVLTQTKA